MIERGDKMIGIHIPAGWKHGPLERNECEKSLKQAEEFFSRHFPEHDFKAFICCSWLLDPQLSVALGSPSNISQFQSRFHLVPVNGDDHQTLERVFDGKFSSWDSAPQDTSLRRAIISHAKHGGVWREVFGFILRDSFLC